MPITHTCRISGKDFVITDQEIALLDKLSPIIGWEKFSLPLPTLCPEERMRRRAQFKNYFSLFKRKCDITGKDVISMHPIDSPYTVYNQEYWWSDSWNPLDLGKEYVPNLSVFEQIHQTYLRTPVMTLDNAYLQLENSEYINGNGASKDCYLISMGADNEKCLYGWNIFKSRNIIHSNHITECENCSQSQHLWKCYNIHRSWDSVDCRDSYYLFSCNGCINCIWCVGINNASLHIFNKPCSQEEYNSTKNEILHNPTFRNNFIKKLQEFIRTTWLSSHILTGSENCTGDFCYESKNVIGWFFSWKIEDSLYIYESHFIQDSMDINQWGNQVQLSYDNIAIGDGMNHIYWSMWSWGDCEYHFYTFNCQGWHHLFGCSGLKHTSYCIFNKQYSKEEWESTVKKIILQMQREWSWGEFLDARYALYAYNESHAMEKMPITREEAIKRWLRWSDRGDIFPEGITKTIPAERLPTDIRDIPDDVLNWAILCQKTGKPYKIQPLELEMHRKFGIPLPRLHPITRIQKLFEWDKRVFDFDF